MIRVRFGIFTCVRLFSEIDKEALYIEPELLIDDLVVLVNEFNVDLVPLDLYILIKPCCGRKEPNIDDFEAIVGILFVINHVLKALIQKASKLGVLVD